MFFQSLRYELPYLKSACEDWLLLYSDTSKYEMKKMIKSVERQSKFFMIPHGRIQVYLSVEYTFGNCCFHLSHLHFLSE